MRRRSSSDGRRLCNAERQRGHLSSQSLSISSTAAPSDGKSSEMGELPFPNSPNNCLAVPSTRYTRTPPVKPYAAGSSRTDNDSGSSTMLATTIATLPFGARHAPAIAAGTRFCYSVTPPPREA